MAVSRAAFRYYGSKWRLASLIIDLLPPHMCYCEPYGGSAAVLLRKPPSRYEVYNDLDDDVVNFFRVLREDTAEFIHAVDWSPFARSELDGAYAPTDDPLERARRFYIRARQSFQGPSGRHRSGWNYQAGGGGTKSNIRTWNDTHHLFDVARRLKRVQIEHDDAIAVIQRFDRHETLFYLDPPYLAETRERWATDGYRCEITDDDHRQLADLLHEIKGMAIISSKQSELYDELYRGWERVTQEVRTLQNTTNTEVLYLSPAVAERRLPLLNWDPAGLGPR